MNFARMVFSVVVVLIASYSAAAPKSWLPTDWVAPNSKWLDSERASARSALGSLGTELLILPVQGGENTFDPRERHLITRLISDRVIAATNVLTPNPTSVIRELGSYRSTFPQDDIRSLARYLRAVEILAIYANHDGGGNFDIRAEVTNAGSGKLIREKVWAKLEFSDSEPPSVQVQEILDDIVIFATTKAVAADNHQSSARLDLFDFPVSVEQLVGESKKSALHAAAYLQLIGMLHPSGSFNEVRDQLFERSLVELYKVPSTAPYKRYFEARAYAYLDRRPAAVRALGTPDNAHERALIAALNGNLPMLRDEVEKMGTSALDFMAWRDLLFIEARYGDREERAILDRFLEDRPKWAAFVYRALRDDNRWADYSATTLKLALEQLMPAQVTSLQDVFEKAEVTGEIPSELDLTRLLWRHIEAFDDDQIFTWATDPDNYSIASEIDILDLAKASAVANLVRLVEDDLKIRDLPNSAMAKIREFESLFAGHPALTLQKGRALEALAAKSVGLEQENLRKESATELLNGLFRTGQMTRDAVRVARGYNKYIITALHTRNVPRESGIRMSTKPLRYFEWPKGVDWYYTIPGREFDDGALLGCIDYSWTSFHCLKAQIEHVERNPDSSKSNRGDLLAKNAHRYHGNPQKNEFEIAAARNADDADAEIQQLRSQINSGTTNWSIYYALGRALKRRGNYQGAQEAWLSYPGFQDLDQGVKLSDDNHANYAASSLYWIGQHELALPLLEISANSGTGSGASMSCGARMSLINGDLEAAERWSASRVRRYSSKYAIRDLQQILHIRGRTEVAWSIFEQAQATTQDPQVWSGALVGHRMASAGTQDIVDWIQSSESRKSAEVTVGRLRQKIHLAPRYLLLAGTMDRRPGAELAAAISTLQLGPRPIYEQRDVKDNEQEADLNSRGWVRYRGSALHHDKLLSTFPADQSTRPSEEIDTRYEMLSRAMTAFLNEEFDQAFELFDETAYYYYLDEYLPYFALSATVVGRTDHLQLALESREPDLEKIRLGERFDSSELGYRFDEDLTYAVLASFEGRHDDSMAYLRAALNNRPYIEERSVYPFYQIVDLADRLYARTGIDRYREFALELSRRHTIVLPMYSWAYFVVAKHSKSKAERISATASGLKLDPLSYRGTLLPQDLIEQARQQLAEHGAPYLRRSAEQESLGT